MKLKQKGEGSIGKWQKMMGRGLLALLCLCLLAGTATAQSGSVELELWKKYDDSLSMGNNAIVHQGKLVEEQGQTYLVLSLVPLETRGFKGYLGSMTAKDRDIDVLSYYEGVYDAFNEPEVGTDDLLRGKLYPRELKIPLKENNPEWIEVTVYVPVMAMLGVGEQDARLKVIREEKTIVSDETQKTKKTPQSTKATAPKDTQGYYEAVAQQTPLKLKDGLYQVPIELYHSVENRDSMGNGALGDTAEILIRGDDRRLFIQSKQMTVMDITASLIHIFYEGSDGRYYPAHGHDYSLNLTGDTFARPTVFSFPLTGQDPFIPVYVDPKVEPMGDDPIKARLKLDYDYIKPIDETKSVLYRLTKEGQLETVYASDQAYTLWDKGVELTIPPGSFAEKPYFYANKITGAEQQELQEKQGALAQIEAYRLETLANWEVLDPANPQDMNHQRRLLTSTKPMTVTMPVKNTSTRDGKLYVDGQDTTYEVQGDAVVFTTTKLGVVEWVTASGGAAPGTNNTPNTPVTAAAVLSGKAMAAPVRPITPPTLAPAQTAVLQSSPQATTLEDQLGVVQSQQQTELSANETTRESHVVLYGVPILALAFGIYLLIQLRRVANRAAMDSQLRRWKMEERV